MPHFSSFKSREELNEWYRKYRAKNAEKLKKYNKEYNKKYREENGYHNEENSKRRYPEKQKARGILQRAVRSGKILKKNCEHCGNSKSQGHHPDYTKPLEVIWLCPSCHAIEHKKIKSEGDKV